MEREEYTPLSEWYYRDRAVWEEEYRRRFDSSYAVHLDFTIRDARKESGGFPAFFVETPLCAALLRNILRLDRDVRLLCRSLPPPALEQYRSRCLIDELYLTNGIEGVQSTRKELRTALDSARQAALDSGRAQKTPKRFQSLAGAYEGLSKGEEIPLTDCRDIRAVYDRLLLREVQRDDPKNAPDGLYFRKDPVEVISPTGRVIHTGAYPEEEIIAQTERALLFLRDESVDMLCRIPVFHYLLGYIHPFYDGNGRLGRFLCSYLLSRELAPLIGYRLSYTIEENKGKYYRAFRECGRAENRGDLTPFLHMFLGILETAMENLRGALKKRADAWGASQEILRGMHIREPKFQALYRTLILAALFSDSGGLTFQELRRATGHKESRLRKRLEEIEAAGGGVLRKHEGKYYLDLEAFRRRYSQ